MYCETFASKSGMYARRKPRVKLNDECLVATVKHGDGNGGGLLFFWERELDIKAMISYDFAKTCNTKCGFTEQY